MEGDVVLRVEVRSKRSDEHLTRLEAIDGRKISRA